MPAYASQTEFEEYVEGWVTDNEAALGRLLERASRDVDSFLGPRALVTAGTFAGFKVDPATLPVVYREALSDATCAMAEHRFDVGEAEWAQAGKSGRVKGPDFEVELAKSDDGGRPAITPKVARELRRLKPIRVLHARTH